MSHLTTIKALFASKPALFTFDEQKYDRLQMGVLVSLSISVMTLIIGVGLLLGMRQVSSGSLEPAIIGVFGIMIFSWIFLWFAHPEMAQMKAVKTFIDTLIQALEENEHHFPDGTILGWWFGGEPLIRASHDPSGTWTLKLYTKEGVVYEEWLVTHTGIWKLSGDGVSMLYNPLAQAQVEAVTQLISSQNTFVNLIDKSPDLISFERIIAPPLLEGKSALKKFERRFQKYSD